MDENTQGHVYLLHFMEPFSHAQHYMGWTNDLTKRIKEHRSGRKCKLTEAVALAGITFIVVRTWTGTLSKEKELKRYKNGRRLCPICNQAITDYELEGEK